MPDLPVAVNKIFLDDVVIMARFVIESVLQPGEGGAESDEEHGPDGEVTIVRLRRPRLPDPVSQREMVDSRVNVVEEEHIDASTQIRTVDGVVERMRVDNWTTRINHNVRVLMVQRRLPCCHGDWLSRFRSWD